MKTRSTLKSPCALLLVVIALTARLFADDIPTFSDADVTAFVKSYGQFVTEYVDAYKAAKAGDNSRLQTLEAKSQELQRQVAQIIGKIKPDEAEKFSAFVGQCAQRISDVAKQ
jgi:ubiquinone biosynthesis protein UbiJ